jgi:hypothetical protein
VTLYLVGLLVPAAGLWMFLHFVVQIGRGTLDRFSEPMTATVFFSVTPVRFVVNAAAWVATTMGMTLFGAGVLAMVDPLLLVAPLCGVLAGLAIEKTLEQIGGRSADLGQGSIDALIGRDRRRLAERVDDLPDGWERRALEPALAAWTGPSEPDGYRHRGDPERPARVEAARRSAEALRARIGRGAKLGVVGLAPALVFAGLSSRIAVVEWALLAAAVCATLTLGHALIVRRAQRSIDDWIGRLGSVAGNG